MGPDILALLIPIIAILGGCSIAITKIIVGAKKNSLTDAQVQQLVSKIELLSDDNQVLKDEIDNLRLIASGDYEPEDTKRLIEQKVEEVVSRSRSLNERNR